MRDDFKALGRGDYLAAIEWCKYEMQSLVHQLNSKTTKLADLSALAASAGPMPTLPDNRAWEYFKKGAVVAAFMNGRWYKGVITQEADGGPILFTSSASDSCHSGTKNPSLMLQEEFDYFKDHPEDFSLWLAASDRDYNGKRYTESEFARMIEVMKEGQL